jgi:hypothetical protein
MTITTVTTRGNKPKPFAWSYSKLKNFETCPKRYYAIDVAKDYKEDDDNESLKYGGMVHEALANRINTTHTPLPDTLKHLEPWAAKVLKVPGDKILVEQQMAIREDFKPTTWFGHDVWFRGIADVVKIIGPVAAAIDWKTGQIKEDGVQLALIAACVFAHHPQVQKIRTEFVWLKEDATTRADFTRADMVKVWAGVLPRVVTLRHAHETMNFPPKTGGLCKRFCVVESCPHKGV